MKKIVIWYNPYKDYAYYKVVSFHYRPYRVGMTNAFGHVILLVIPNVKKLEFYKNTGYVWKGVDYDAIRRNNSNV